MSSVPLNVTQALQGSHSPFEFSFGAKCQAIGGVGQASIIAGRQNLLKQQEIGMTAAAQTRNHFIEIVIGYLDLLYQQGVIRNLNDIDTESVIAMTEELRDYFIALHENDAA